MEALFHVPNGNLCAVLYNIGIRSIEYDLLPWCEQRGMPVQAYTSLSAARPRSRWPGPSAAVTLSQCPNPALRRM